jgi:ABC-type multidrug transport system fused ATPase/permease subunit
MKQKKMLGLFTAIISFIWGAICVYQSYLVGATVDGIFLGLENNVTDIAGLSQAITSILILIVTLIIGWILTSVTIYCIWLYGIRIAQIVRSDLFYALQNQSMKFYDINNTGDLVSKSTNDVTLIRRFLAIFILLAPIAISEFIFCIGFLLLIDVPVAIYCIFTIPLAVLFSHWAKKDYGSTFELSRKQLGLITKVITENVESANLTRVFNSKEVDIQRFDEENIKYRDTSLKAKKTQARIEPIADAMYYITYTGVFLIGGLRVIDGFISIGMLISIIFLIVWLAVPVRHVTNLLVEGSQAKAAGTRILEILHDIPEIQNDPKALILPNDSPGKIVFDGVSFGYQSEPVLKDINITIDAGSTIALLGGMGSGKTSLINLIPRFYDPIKGNIKIDEVDIKKIQLESLRRTIGFVDQESFLFNNTIAENIRFGKPNATFEEIKEVAKIASINNFIDSLPDNYETIIGERGITLSGGQRQRLSIARCLLADPRIIIFDDSLSAVDIKTEREIEKALHAVTKNRTTIIVTQRLSSVKIADQCVVIHQGRIIENGTHEDLLKQNGAYSMLYSSQVDNLLDLSILKEIKV